MRLLVSDITITTRISLHGYHYIAKASFGRVNFMIIPCLIMVWTRLLAQKEPVPMPADGADGAGADAGAGAGALTSDLQRALVNAACGTRCI